MGRAQFAILVLAGGIAAGALPGALVPHVRAQTYEADPSWTASIVYGQLGLSVDGGLDEDGDGFAEIIVGAPSFLASGCCPSTNQEGLMRLYFGSPGGPGPVLPEIGSSSGTTLAYRVRSAGDVDGDGYDDVLFNSGSGFGGGFHQVHVRFGAVKRFFSNAWTFDSGQLYGALGPAIDGDGDVNGDSKSDVIAGFSLSDGGLGRVRVFYGSAAGLPALPDWERVGSAANERLGMAVAFVGDVDGDGYDEALICGADEYELFRGSTTGLETNPSWSVAKKPQGSCFPDRPIGRAGDLNGDGYDDVVIGALAGSTAGEVSIFFGSSGGLPATPSQALLGGPYFGYSVAGVGDRNGDGFDDLLITAPSFGGGDSGKLSLFLGSVSGVQPTAAWISNDQSGAPNLGVSAASAGDVNGDGLDDLIAGDPGNNRVSLYYGTNALTPGAAGAIGDGGSPQLQLARAADGTVVLDWGPSCLAGPEDYVIYEGAIGNYASHQPTTCSTAGMTSWTVSGDGGDRYFIVVPRSLDSEGSHGAGDAGQRLPPISACLPQVPANCP